MKIRVSNNLFVFDLVGQTTEKALQMNTHQLPLTIFTANKRLRQNYPLKIVGAPRLDLTVLGPQALPGNLRDPFLKSANTESNLNTVIIVQRLGKQLPPRLYNDLRKPSDDWFRQLNQWRERRDEANSKLTQIVQLVLGHQTGGAVINFADEDRFIGEWVIKQILQTATAMRERLHEETIRTQPLDIVVVGPIELKAKTYWNDLNIRVTTTLQADLVPNPHNQLQPKPDWATDLIKTPSDAELTKSLIDAVQAALRENPDELIHAIYDRGEPRPVASLSDSPLLGSCAKHTRLRVPADQKAHLTELGILLEDSLDLLHESAMTPGQPLHMAIHTLAETHPHRPLALPLKRGTWHNQNSVIPDSLLLPLTKKAVADVPWSNDNLETLRVTKPPETIRRIRL